MSCTACNKLPQQSDLQGLLHEQHAWAERILLLVLARWEGLHWPESLKPSPVTVIATVCFSSLAANVMSSDQMPFLHLQMDRIHTSCCMQHAPLQLIGPGRVIPGRCDASFHGCRLPGGGDLSKILVRFLPRKQYRGHLLPITPAKAGPQWIPAASHTAAQEISSWSSAAQRCWHDCLLVPT